VLTTDNSPGSLPQPRATIPDAFDNASPTASTERLTAAIESAVRYLDLSIDSAGRFFYRFDPTTGKVDQSEYNIVRHAGTLDCLSASHNGNANQTIAMAKRFLASHSRRMAGSSLASGVRDEKSRYNLGATALAVSALARSCESSFDEELFEEFLAFVLFSQYPDGGFTCRYLSDGCPDDYRSPYYEGEAAYALGVIYEVCHRKELEQPILSALSCLTSRKLSFPGMLLQHWTVKAMRPAVKAGFWTDPTFALECASAMCMYCDSVTESHPLEPTGTLATKGEALWSLVDIFHYLGRNDRANECLERALWINSLLLQRQYVMGFALGGFCYSLTEGYVRMDTVQHTLTCLTEQLDHA
jgi:hypothetical protein